MTWETDIRVLDGGDQIDEPAVIIPTRVLRYLLGNGKAEKILSECVQAQDLSGMRIVYLKGEEEQ